MKAELSYGDQPHPAYWAARTNDQDQVHFRTNAEFGAGSETLFYRRGWNEELEVSLADDRLPTSFEAPEKAANEKNEPMNTHTSQFQFSTKTGTYETGLLVLVGHAI